MYSPNTAKQHIINSAKIHPKDVNILEIVDFMAELFAQFAASAGRAQ